METRRFVFLHGSPGRARDFARVTEVLKQKRSESSVFLARPRYALESNQAQISVRDLKAGDIVVGYSWGAAEALILAAESLVAPRALVLIAPYVKPESELSPVARVLLQTPLLSNVLLTLMRPKIRREFIKATAAPNEPTEAYAADVTQAMTISSLRAAALEKNPARIQSAIRTVSRRPLPILILSGQNDIVAPASAHLEALKAAFPQARVETFAPAGHALPWTHANAIADSIDQFLKTLNSTTEAPNETRI